MAQHLTDLGEAAAAAEHLARRAVAEPVRAHPRDAGAGEGVFDDAMDGADRDPPDRRVHALEHDAVVSALAGVGEVVGEHLADISGERHHFVAVALAPHVDSMERVALLDLVALTTSFVTNPAP